MAAVIREKGAPGVLRWEAVEVADPGPGEGRIRNEAVGLNFVDTYHRRGIPHPWPVPPLAVVLGFEGAGRVEEVDPGDVVLVHAAAGGTDPFSASGQATSGQPSSAR